MLIKTKYFHDEPSQLSYFISHVIVISRSVALITYCSWPRHCSPGSLLFRHTCVHDWGIDCRRYTSLHRLKEIMHFIGQEWGTSPVPSDKTIPLCKLLVALLTCYVVLTTVHLICPVIRVQVVKLITMGCPITHVIIEDAYAASTVKLTNGTRVCKTIIFIVYLIVTV